MAPATQYMTHPGGYPHPSYADQRWPLLQAHSQTLRSPGWGVMATGPSTVIPAPSNAPYGNWGNHQSGPPNSMFHQYNVHTPYHLGAGPTRARVAPTRRFQPYESHRADTPEHMNADAPTIVALPSAPDDPQSPEPSEGTSETAGDSDSPKRTRLPRGQGKPRKHRMKVKGDALRLFDWTQKRRVREESPSFNQVLAEAVQVISSIRPVVSETPYLAKTATKDTEAPTGSAKKERNRRLVERELYEELSRHYPRGPKPWARPQLLAHLVEDLENNPALQNPSD
ncbi:hypothetical protein BJ322DRAFT_674428 [Thelephora terrestris]|uniref:BHLH domain-containing protein n=1 Tax=Thelephora terrestris TaxID=56493 RepID=A0A9P6L847_9AGAM|nr:hypothetical protein BJ322DRAFT_674428 [Thelephora terrestris]